MAVIALSLSIGWGIRGNFGHEYGAMLPGALAAIALAIASGREDWLRRVHYIAFFSAIGWAFGGSIAYMYTLSYTHSGHLPTQIYGCAAVVLMGFLWSSLGGAGAALAVSESRDKLTALFKPIATIFIAWALLDMLPMNDRDMRHTGRYYWLDSDWMQASSALAALCLYDLYRRRFHRIHWLALLIVAGAGFGYLLQTSGVLAMLEWRQGDVLNHPPVFDGIGGIVIGIALGATVYFAKWGEFPDGSSLLVHMASGGMISFLLLPVLLQLRLGPPRGDNWSIVLGILGGVLIWSRKNLPAVGAAALMTGALGSVGFLLSQFIKLLLLIPGNPVITTDPATVEAWRHWRSTNWHSLVAEQFTGVMLGLAFGTAMFVVARREKYRGEDPHERRWTEVFAVTFVLALLPYVNLVKNVSEWVNAKAVPATMQAPLFASIDLSARAWFNLTFALFAAALIWMLTRMLRRPISAVPQTWEGRAQLLWIALAAIMIAGNFERALVRFHQVRLATEWVIAVNGMLVAVLLLTTVWQPIRQAADSYFSTVRRVVLIAATAFVVIAVSLVGVMQAVYGRQADGWGGRHIRFGPEADWIVKPLRGDQQHR